MQFLLLALFGPDLQNEFHHSGLSEEEVIKRHSSWIIAICLVTPDYTRDG